MNINGHEIYELIIVCASYNTSLSRTTKGLNTFISTVKQYKEDKYEGYKGKPFTNQ